MVRVVNSKCPQCGAQLQIDPRSEMVTCRYCGHNALVEWEGRTRRPTAQFQQWQADPTFGRIAVQPPRAAGIVVAIVVVAAVIPLAIVGFVVTAATRHTTKQTTTVTFTAPPGLQIAIPAATAALNKVQAPDPRTVDIADVVRQARAVAAAQESHVDRLSSVVASNVAGGALDTTQQNAASVSFSFRYTDPTKPPGQKDVVQGSVNVHVANGAMTPSRMDAFYREKALAEPKCASRDAWAAAVKSGVPANAVTTFHLYDNTAFSPKSPTVWSIRVDGHDEYRREIDAVTCAVVKNWGDSGKKTKR